MIYKNKTFTQNDLKGKDFNGDTFEHCIFVGEIKFVNFSECIFKNSDFSQGLYNIVSFFDCSFPDSKLSNIDFSNISIENCDFTDSILENCVLRKKKKFNLKSVTFENTKLSGAVFVFCNLEGQKIKNCDLTSVVFERCNLKNTDFTESKIDGIGFEDCNIENTVLDLNGFISYGNSKGFIV
jgi:uncharacterized protein YjbI with pentapeptide repeats